MEKLDLSKKYKTYFTAKPRPELVTVEKAQFLSLLGKGDPSSKTFTENIEALYSTAYALKFDCKAQGHDFVVSKLEGLWWYDEKKYPNKTIATAVDVPRSEWEYRLLIRMPDVVKKKDLDRAKASVMGKKNLPLVQQIELYTMMEGTCVQMLHVGPFSTEPESLQHMNAFMEANRLSRNGVHHEIYLSDFRKTEPHKLKTILREPVQKK